MTLHRDFPPQALGRNGTPYQPPAEKRLRGDPDMPTVAAAEAFCAWAASKGYHVARRHAPYMCLEGKTVADFESSRA